jgi:hypothetical protein
MATSDRKRRILDHVIQSADGLKFLNTNLKSAAPEPETPLPIVEPPPIAPPPVSITKVSSEERKRRILNHVTQSSGEFGSFSLNPSESEKKRVLEHLRKSVEP